MIYQYGTIFTPGNNKWLGRRNIFTNLIEVFTFNHWHELRLKGAVFSPNPNQYIFRKLATITLFLLIMTNFVSNWMVLPFVLLMAETYLLEQPE